MPRDWSKGYEVTSFGVISDGNGDCVGEVDGDGVGNDDGGCDGWDDDDDWSISIVLVVVWLLWLFCCTINLILLSIMSVTTAGTISEFESISDCESLSIK